MKMVIVLIIGLMTLVACEGNVFSLKVGDCYNQQDYNSEVMIEISDVDLVNCEEPHELEVFAVFDLPESNWKGDDATYDLAGEGCMNRFEPFVGVAFELSTLWFEFIYPTVESWNDLDDRIVQCSIFATDDKEEIMMVTGSLKGSKR